MEDLLVKCDTVGYVAAGGFMRPALEVSLENVDTDDLSCDLCKKLGINEILKNFAEQEILDYMEEMGYKLIEADLHE